MRSSRRQQEPFLLRMQDKKASRRKVILQVAQDVIVLNVDIQRAKYGASKGIVETAQLVYPRITRDQVYDNTRLLKQRGRENGAPPPAGGGQPEGLQQVMI